MWICYIQVSEGRTRLSESERKAIERERRARRRRDEDKEGKVSVCCSVSVSRTSFVDGEKGIEASKLHTRWIIGEVDSMHEAKNLHEKRERKR